MIYFFPIQLHREHRGPQSSRRPACSLADSTQTRNSWFNKTHLYYLRSLLFKRFENKIVRSPENKQSLAGLRELCAPLCPLCNFLPLKPTLPVNPVNPVKQTTITMTSNHKPFTTETRRTEDRSQKIASSGLRAPSCLRSEQNSVFISSSFSNPITQRTQSAPAARHRGHGGPSGCAFGCCVSVDSFF